MMNALLKLFSFLGLAATPMEAQGATMQTKTLRKPDYAVHEMIVHRWSPRSMSGETISDKELNQLFEAARWAPSSYNSQPWVFIYAKRDTKQWGPLFDLMADFNKEWTKNAAVLVVVVSRDTFAHNGEPSRTHSFDTGAAWQNLALQGSHMGLVIHGMSGFDYDKAKKSLNIPDGYTIEAMFAIGKPGKTEDLPEYMREMEKPSDRNKVEQFAFEGSFKE